LFGCLLAQLTQQSDGVRKAASEYLATFDKSYVGHVGSRATDYEKLSGIMVQRHDDLETVFIVVDALDELFPLSSDTEQNHQNSKHLKRVLRELIQMTEKSRKLKILITSRPTSAIEPLLGKVPNISITSQMNSADIRRLMESKIDEEICDHTRWGTRLEQDKALKSGLLSSLVKKADGM